MPATPDTSKANVARVLRELSLTLAKHSTNAIAGEGYALAYVLEQPTAPAEVARILRLCAAQMAQNNLGSAVSDEAYALADALEQQAATPTWEERERAAHNAYYDDKLTIPERLPAALRAAFPELAPSDD